MHLQPTGIACAHSCHHLHSLSSLPWLDAISSLPVQIVCQITVVPSKQSLQLGSHVCIVGGGVGVHVD